MKNKIVAAVAASLALIGSAAKADDFAIVVDWQADGIQFVPDDQYDYCLFVGCGENPQTFSAGGEYTFHQTSADFTGGSVPVANGGSAELFQYGVSYYLPDSSFDGFSGYYFSTYGGWNVESVVDVTLVPEPANIALMLAGLGLTGAAVRRRKS